MNNDDGNGSNNNTSNSPGSEGASCGTCRRPDTNRMVQCDQCDVWYHYECAGVDESVANRDWICVKCERKSLLKERVSLIGERDELRKQQKRWQQDLQQQKRLEKQQQQQLETQQQMLDHFEQLQLQWPMSQPYSRQSEVLAPSIGKENSSTDLPGRNTGTIPKDVTFCRSGNLRVEEQHEPSVNRSIDPNGSLNRTKKAGSKSSRRSEKAKEMQLRALEARQELEKRQLEERLALEQELLESSDSEVETVMSNKQLEDWLDETVRVEGDYMNEIQMNETPLPKYTVNPQMIAKPGMLRTQHTSTPRAANSCLRENTEKAVTLNKNHLAARQTVKDLPKFGGDPEDWPRFIAAFERSSRMCAFGNDELLDRLERCLYDRALNAVKCLLLHPDNVPTIINRLQTLFGNPDSIIETMIRRVRTLPPPKAERMETIIDFGIAVQNLCATIQACRMNERLYNATLIQELVEVLPYPLKDKWARHMYKTGASSLLDFNDWIEKIVDAYSLVTRPQAWAKSSVKTKKDEAFLHVHTESSIEVVSGKCFACAGECAGLDVCPRFNAMTTTSRWSLVNDKKICRKCLKKHFKACTIRVQCNKDGCQYLHHWLLHDVKKHKANIQKPPQTSSCNAHHGSREAVLLKYVPVTVYGKYKSVTTYAFLDAGSTCTLMEHSLWNELNLEGKRHPLCISWTAGQGRYEGDSVKFSVDISSTSNQKNKFKLSNVHTVRSLDLPSQSLCLSELANHFHHLSEIPVESYVDAKPRILLGMDNIRLEYPFDSKEGAENQPTAVLTRLGWIIYGPCSVPETAISEENEQAFSYHICQCETLNSAIRDYFSFDSLGISTNMNRLSSDDSRALDLLRSNTVYRNGRFETCLLWRYDDITLPDSKAMALKRHLCLEKRMIREPKMAKELQQKLFEYEVKGYIRKLSAQEEREHQGRQWYLPIFPVFNPNKPGKLRIVWDAASKSRGVSLNSFLLKGPDQLVALPHVLQRFREYRVAVSGDIREMFHQVNMNELDQHCQRFLWNDGVIGKAPTVYIMRVMTFGASCSPSSAQYVKNSNAERFVTKYPKAVYAIRSETYVDDMLISVETDIEAIQLVKDVRMIHSEGGFEIRGWLSNSTQVLRALGEKSTVHKDLNVDNELSSEKVLGMWWNTAEDIFTFKVPRRCNQEILSGNETPTKREVLRVLMLIYDPLGMLSNFLMYLKVLLQEIWRSGVGWDEPIHDEQLSKWRTWLNVLKQVETVSVPRCYRRLTSANPSTKVQLHVFVDASENGYAAVAYFRYEECNQIECAFVTSKTRVAPLRYVSIPRLELQAAVIGVRLANDIGESHRINLAQRFFWTDSRDVLCWIRADHRKYSKFVAARVGEILEGSEIAEWNWIESSENVADEGTKWQKIPDFSTSNRWFNGPKFIRQEQTLWPSQPPYSRNTATELQKFINIHIIQQPPFDVTTFSKWWKLVRVISFVIRYLQNLRATIQETKLSTGVLTQSELQAAEICIFRQAQKDAYAEEISLLSSSDKNITLPKRSPLYKVSPFLDANGVLRMRGRIGACMFVDLNTAHPILLPKEHHVTMLIVQYMHERYHHINNETVINELRQQYQIPMLRRVCDRVRRKCQACKIVKANPQPPLMADLPFARLAAYCRPFSYVGVDYFGPLNVVVGRRVEKRWGVLLTCLVVRAVHIEIAHSLNTSSCIMALHNFIARRGKPLEIFSDRGTNFVGANRELKQALRDMDQDKLMEEFISTELKWSFLPPSSPHMGGSWERLVQSVKKTLSNMKLPRLPTDEVLRNALLEIENIINSRPLTYLPVENSDTEALTPNHFLLGSSSGVKPAVPYDDKSNTLRNTWKTSQVYANYFWKRWLQEYLPTITRRTKWHYNVKPIEVDDIVVIVDNDLPRNLWPKGIVISTTKSRDGQVRSATVRTACNTYERPAVKLAVLDVGATSSKQRD
ncbi:uncharacterized protein LOC129753329 [Uranotaenia lowii]|uniref:uncharacterized protein LOC129753329 n=1 Tax=Uranotaenia lowii TaxID=190385 RepID=UPI0024799599|nr:uncharacterized protein LOC129753329 [Uranotaenia lowii]